MNFHLKILLAGTLTIGSYSCKKESKGPATVSNGIKTSEWYFPVTANRNSWEELTNVTGDKYFRTEIPAPSISNSDIENSVILVYGKLTGYDPSEYDIDKVSLLPSAIYRTKVLASVDEWTLAVNSGTISIRLQNSKNYYPNGKPDPENSFRYIVIPKSTALVTGQKPENINPLSRYSEAELRTLSYEQICETAGLKK